jgi:uncharacterized protein YjbJ (UPF0337 family)
VERECRRHAATALFHCRHRASVATLNRLVSRARISLTPHPPRKQHGQAHSGHYREALNMDKNRTEGAKNQVKGTVKEVAGKVTGDKAQELEGKAQKTVGKVQSEVGKAKDNARH